MSDSLRPHELQNNTLPCPSLSPWVCSNSSPLSQWYHPTISSSVIRFSSWLQSFPASGYFLMTQFFTSGSQSIRVSAATSVLPMNTQGWYSLGLTGLVSLLSKGLKNLLLQHNLKASVLGWFAFYMVQLSHLYMTTGKTIALSILTDVCKVIISAF